MTCSKCKGFAYSDPDPRNPGDWTVCVNCGNRGGDGAPTPSPFGLRATARTDAAIRKDPEDGRGRYIRTPETRAKLSASIRAAHIRQGHKTRLIPVTLFIDAAQLRSLLAQA
jgi:hypothetical protein